MSIDVKIKKEFGDYIIDFNENEDLLSKLFNNFGGHVEIMQGPVGVMHGGLDNEYEIKASTVMTKIGMDKIDVTKIGMDDMDATEEVIKLVLPQVIDEYISMASGDIAIWQVIVTPLLTEIQVKIRGYIQTT